MKHLIFVFVLATLFNLLSCQSVDKKQAVVDLSEEQFNDFVSGLVREDTLAVENLVDKFMTCVQNKQYQLSNEEMSNVVCMLKQIPVLSYRINNIKFKTALMNEVKCTIVMREADGTVPEAANKWYFKPVNYLGGWRLCLMDSNS